MKYTEDINVKLLNKNDCKNFLNKFGEVACVCYDTNTKYKEKVGLSCLNNGHMSGSRGFYFIFEIDCPRYTADQLMRQEVGVFKNCQSQRYVDKDSLDIYVPNCADNSIYLMYKDIELHLNYMLNILKAKYKNNGYSDKEINDLVRTIYPIGCFTKLRIGFTLEALINLCNKRLCVRADKPIRIVTKQIKAEVLKVCPYLEEYLVPQCEKLLYCTEGNGSCNRFPSKERLIEKLKGGENNE